MTETSSWAIARERLSIGTSKSKTGFRARRGSLTLDPGGYKNKGAASKSPTPNISTHSLVAKGGIASSLKRGQGSNDPATQILLNLARLLKEFDFFADLDKDVQASLPDIVSYDSESKGTILFRQGAPPGRCYILLSGSVEVWKDNSLHLLSPHGANRNKSTKPPAVIEPSTPASPAAPAEPQGFDFLEDDQGDDSQQADGDESQTAGARARTLRRNLPFLAGNPVVVRKCRAMAEMLASMSIDGVGARTLLSPKQTTSPWGGLSPGRSPFFPGSPGGRPISPTNSEDLGDSDTHPPGHPVTYLGPGMLFGETALIEDQPRNASIRCKESCEFLVIEREYFENVLRANMQRSHLAKLDFLRLHVPGFRDLSDRRAEDISYLFKKATYTKNHHFATQGGLTNGVVNVVAKGAVEFTLCSTAKVPVFDGLPEIQSRRLGVLVSGGIFGSFHLNRHDPFNVVATTATCDVYRLTRDDYRRLPESVLHGIRQVIEQTTQFQLHRCDSSASSALAGVMNKGKKPVGFVNKRKPWRKKATVAWPDAVSAEPPDFNLAPGECIAMTGKRPNLRRPATSIHSQSMPDLQRPASTG